MPSEIRIDTPADGIVHLVLQRSEKNNALNDTMVEELHESVQRCTRDRVRLLALSGEGRGFCGGFDFTGIESLGDADLAQRLLRIELVLQALHHAPFPTLCLAHGAVYGAGADIFGACSLRLCDPGTTFKMPGLGFGVVLGTRRFIATVGEPAGVGILAQTRSFGAAEALSIGFATAVSPRERWPQEVEQAASTAQALPADSIAALHAARHGDHRAQDMLALVQSVARPGLRERMINYRASVKRAAQGAAR